MRTIRAIFYSLTAVMATACADSPVASPSQGLTLVATTFHQLVGVAGNTLDVSPAVRVYRDQQPAAGVRVEFNVFAPIPAGTGGRVAVTHTMTDRDGLATPGAWTLGETPGINELTARIEGGREVTFKALALPSIDEASRRYELLDINGVSDRVGISIHASYDVDDRNRFVAKMSWVCQGAPTTCTSVSVGSVDFRDDQLVFDYAAPWPYADEEREVASVKGDTLSFVRFEHEEEGCFFCSQIWRYLRR